MQLRHGVQIKFLQIKNLTGGHLAQFWVHSTFRVQLIVLHAVTCNFYFILFYLIFKTKQTRLPNESCQWRDPIQFISSSLTSTYRWARQASTRSSCCAAGPGSSGWLAPYPGSCWASPSTAPYLPRDKHARSSLILLSSRPPLTMRGQRFSEERERKKKRKEDVWDKSERNGRPKVEPSSRMQSWNGLWDPWCDFVNAKQMASARRAVFYFALPQYYHLLFRLLTETNKRRLSVELGFQMFDLWTPANSI